MENYIVALDLGTTQTRAVTCYSDDKQPFGIGILSMEKLDSHGVRRGSVFNSSDASNVINQLIIGGAEKRIAENKQKKRGVQIGKFFCTNLSGLSFKTNVVRESVSIGTMGVDKSTIRRLEDVVRQTQERMLADNEKVFRIEPIAYSIDNSTETTDILGKQGSVIEGRYLCYMLNLNNIEAQNNAFPSKAKPTDFCTIASAKGIVLLTPEQRIGGVALVDIGASTINIAAYYRGALRYEVSIPLGSDLITKDIAKGLDISYEDAERLKCHQGIMSQEKEKKHLSYQLHDGTSVDFSGSKYNFIVKARVEELSAYIYTALSEARQRGVREMTIMLTGGGAKLNGIDEVISKYTNIEVQHVITQYRDFDDETLLHYSGVIGMASYVCRNRVLSSEKEEAAAQAAAQNAAQNQEKQTVVEPEQKPEPVTADDPDSLDNNKQIGKTRGGMRAFIKNVFENLGKDVG